jgi:hypothetical protein
MEDDAEGGWSDGPSFEDTLGTPEVGWSDGPSFEDTLEPPEGSASDSAPFAPPTIEEVLQHAKVVADGLEIDFDVYHMGPDDEGIILEIRKELPDLIIEYITSSTKKNLPRLHELKQDIIDGLVVTTLDTRYRTIMAMTQ